MHKNKDIERKEPNNAIVYLSLFDVKVCLSIPKEAKQAFELEYKRILPQTNLNLARTKPDILINLSRGKPSFISTHGSVHVSEEAEPAQMAIDAAFLVSRFLEVELNKRNSFSLFASGIAHGNKGLIFIGGDGAGKTTSAAMACIRDRDVKLISGDRIVIQGKSIIGGTTRLNFRIGTILTEFKGLDEGIIKNLRRNVALEKQQFEEKIFVDPENLGIKVNSMYPIELVGILAPKKLDRELYIKETEMSGTPEFLRVLSSITWFGNNMPYVVAGGRIPYPDSTTYATRFKGVELAGQLTDSLPFAYVEGRVHDIADFAITKLKR